MAMAMQKSEQVRPGIASATASPVGYTLPAPQTKLRIPMSSRASGALLGVISGALLWACYFPLGWSPLAWVALAPLLGLVRTQIRPLYLYLCAYLGGSVFFWPILSWMTYGDQGMGFAWAGLALYCALYFPAAIWLTRLLERRTALPLVVTLPVVWVGLEFVRSFLLSGFAWYYLGHSQHTVLPLIQIADLGGVYAVSLLIAAVNAWLFDLAYQFEGVRKLFHLKEPPGTRAARIIEGRELLGEIFRRRIFVEAGAVAILLAGAVGYGHLRMGQERFLPGPRIALLQGSLDQKIRDASTSPQAIDNLLQDITNHYDVLCTMAARQSPRPDLIIWPETSFPYKWYEASLNVPPHKIPPKNSQRESAIREALEIVVKRYQTPMLFGMNAVVIDDEGRETKRNAAVLINATGSQRGRYDKVHRVPFGEFVPFRETLPIMNMLSPYDYDYSIAAGETMPRLPLKQYHFGVLICYEDTDPFLARRYGRDTEDGGPVDFLVNMSNDGWFSGSNEHEEHLAISRFRAIETRRALVRSVNMGISAVIDGNGRVQRPQIIPGGGAFKRWVIQEEHGMIPDLAEGDWADFKKVGGVLTATVPLDQRTSWYALLGDWLPGLCWLLIGVVMILAVVDRLRGRKKTVLV